MATILKQIKHFKPILILAMLLISVATCFAQVKHQHSETKHHRFSSKKLTEFILLAAQAHASFMFPKGFKEVKAPNDEDFSFDYAIAIPDNEFEIWFQVKSQKENWASYERNKNSKTEALDNPDSTYTSTAVSIAKTLAGDDSYLVRNLPPEILTRYNADAGKSFLLTLLDNPATKHYKYALIFGLQKFHTGTIIAVCFTNFKGPEFFKNVSKANNCLKFKP